MVVETIWLVFSFMAFAINGLLSDKGEKSDGIDFDVEIYWNNITYSVDILEKWVSKIQKKFIINHQKTKITEKLVFLVKTSVLRFSTFSKIQANLIVNFWKIS